MTEGFAAFAEELLQPYGKVTSRRMFGGHGFYLDGRFVAIVWKDTLYLKAAGEGKEICEAAGLRRFRPSSKTPGYSLGFFAPPDDALEDPDALRPWVEIALTAALSAPARRKAPRPRSGASRRSKRS